MTQIPGAPPETDSNSSPAQPTIPTTTKNLSGKDKMTTIAIVPILQTAIGPVILISGVGLLLLTMTNRLARTIDDLTRHGDESPAMAAAHRAAGKRRRCRDLVAAVAAMVGRPCSPSSRAHA